MITGLDLPGYSGYNYIQGSPVLCTQFADEFAALLKIYKRFKPNNVLEIGTHYGGTLWHWLNSGGDYCNVTVVDDHHLNETEYNSWKRSEHQRINVIKGKSQNSEAMNKIEQCSFPVGYDWIFIDGGHSYEEVKSDWNLALRVSDINSTVVFHDIVPHKNTEADRIWKEIKSQGHATLELVEDWKQDGCGLGVVLL